MVTVIVDGQKKEYGVTKETVESNENSMQLGELLKVGGLVRRLISEQKLRSEQDDQTKEYRMGRIVNELYSTLYYTQRKEMTVGELVKKGKCGCRKVGVIYHTKENGCRCGKGYSTTYKINNGKYTVHYGTKLVVEAVLDVNGDLIINSF